jgi:hypothetical protein
MDKVNMTKNKNRRASFRIYDQVSLFYQKIDKQLLTELHPAFDNMLNNHSLSKEFEGVSQDLASLLASQEKNLPDVMIPDFQINGHETCDVNISASGMAFNCEDALKEGDYLVIKILLLPSKTTILTYCKVVYCKNSNPFESQYPYLVGTHFINMKDEDRELLSKHVAKKKAQQIVVKGFILTIVISVIALPGLVFGLLLELFHLLFEYFLEFIHLAFEFVELNLDKLVEHLFDTDLHQTQVIVFYIIISIVLYGFYRLYRALPPFCQQCKKNQILYWSRKKASWLFFWREQSLFNKLKLIVIGAAAITGYIFFSM